MVYPADLQYHSFGIALLLFYNTFDKKWMQRKKEGKNMGTASSCQCLARGARDDCRSKEGAQNAARERERKRRGW